MKKKSIFKKKERYFDGWVKEDCWADYPGVGKVYDSDIADFVVKHLSFWDRFNPKKVAFATLYAQLMFFKVEDIPKDKNFKW